MQSRSVAMAGIVEERYRRTPRRPGEAPKQGLARPVFLLADRLDSIIGLLTAVSLAVPTPAVTWGVVLVIGPGIHYAFSHLLFVVGVKARSA